MKLRRFEFFGAACALLVGFATPAAAQPADVGVYALGPGRIGAIVAVVAGLLGVVIGALALRAARRIGTGAGRKKAVGALAAGSIGMAIGGWVVATAGGGLGTGHGLGGGVVALVVGSIGVVLGGLARAR
jgi:hypothetical protein